MVLTRASFLPPLSTIRNSIGGRIKQGGDWKLEHRLTSFNRPSPPLISRPCSKGNRVGFEDGRGINAGSRTRFSPFFHRWLVIERGRPAFRPTDGFDSGEAAGVAIAASSSRRVIPLQKPRNACNEPKFRMTLFPIVSPSPPLPFPSFDRPQHETRFLLASAPFDHRSPLILLGRPKTAPVHGLSPPIYPRFLGDRRSIDRSLPISTRVLSRKMEFFFFFFFPTTEELD